MARHALVLVSLLLVGCVGQGANRARVFVPVSGAVTFRVQTAAVFERVVYLVDSREVATATDPANGYPARFNTEVLADGLHTVTALGISPEGTREVLFTQSILVDN